MRVDAYVEQRRGIQGFRDSLTGQYSDIYPSYEEDLNIIVFQVGKRAVSMKLTPEQVEKAYEISTMISFGNIESEYPDHDWEYTSNFGMKCKRCGYKVGNGMFTTEPIPECNEHAMSEALK